MTDFLVADLFAGAGGMSTGCLEAATARDTRVNLVAVNHWPRAVETHTVNHPEARHFCAPVETLDPRVAIPGGKLDLLIAAPECTHHSTARGGKPINDQSRASAWHILRWVELLDVAHVLIENVPEFQTWGPLGKNLRPLKAKKGETFLAFVNALRSYGYAVEWKVLNAADYGAATTRRRLFIQAKKGRRAIAWPAPTHSKTGSPTLFGGTKKWRAAREIIDWTLPSLSIFDRKRPLRPATMRRILEGLRRYGGPQIQPFLVVLRNHMAGQSIEGPLPTIAAGGTHVGLAQPMIVKLTHGDRKRERPVDEPLPTITSAHRGELGLVEPILIEAAHGSGGGRGDSGRVHSLDAPIGAVPTETLAERWPVIVPYHAERDGQTPRAPSVDAPLPVVPTSRVFGIAESFIVPFRSDSDGRAPRVKSFDDPLQTITTENPIGLVEPVLIPQGGGGVARPVSRPAPTIATDGAIAVVEPIIFANRTNNTPKSIDDPVPSLCTGEHIVLVEPVIAKYYGTSHAAKPVTQPLDAVTSKARFGLVQPVIDGYVLDIRFRMLQPHELAGAMSFPKAYVFTGNKGEQIKQIGNAVDVSMARALCGAILEDRRGTGKSPRSERVA